MSRYGNARIGICRTCAIEESNAMVDDLSFLNTVDNLYQNINHLTPKDLDIINAISNRIIHNDYSEVQRIIDNG